MSGAKAFPAGLMLPNKFNQLVCRASSCIQLKSINNSKRLWKFGISFLQKLSLPEMFRVSVVCNSSVANPVRNSACLLTQIAMRIAASVRRRTDNRSGNHSNSERAAPLDQPIPGGRDACNARPQFYEFSCTVHSYFFVATQSFADVFGW